MAEPEGLAAALLQLSAHAERLSSLEQRQAAHAADIGERIATLTTLANAMNGTLADQAEILAGLIGLDEQVATLAARLDAIAPDDGGEPVAYQPAGPPRFWKLEGEARQEAIAKLRAWVEQVYRPGYGHLSAALAAAGSSTRYACTPWTGSASCGPCSTSSPSGPPGPSPGRRNGR